MILKKKNPNSNTENALQILAVDGFCCDDPIKTIVCKYNLVIDITSVTSASLISLGGTEYPFHSGAVPTNTEAGRTALVAEIKAVLTSIGYTNDGIELALNGNNLTIAVWYSQISFDYLEAAGNAFTKAECKVHGDILSGTDCCTTFVYEQDADDLIISPVSCMPITNVLVNDGTNDIYNDSLGTITEKQGLNANITSINNQITIDTAGQSYSGAVTFTVTISSQGCDNDADSFTITFA